MTKQEYKKRTYGFGRKVAKRLFEADRHLLYTDAIEKLASDLGLNISRYHDDLRSQELLDHVTQVLGVSPYHAGLRIADDIFVGMQKVRSEILEPNKED